MKDRLVIMLNGKIIQNVSGVNHAKSLPLTLHTNGRICETFFQKIGGYCPVSETSVLGLLKIYAPQSAGGSPHLHTSPPVCDGFLWLRKYVQFNIFLSLSFFEYLNRKVISQV